MPKTPWYTRNRRAQQAWKRNTATLPDAARAMGRTWVEVRGRRKRVGPFPICLPEDLADHNLLAEVREEAIARMAAHGIAWHAGEEGPDGTPWPSTHLLDSQVQCLNVMLSLAARPDALLAFARQAEPDAVGLVPVEDGSPVAPEWIGLSDHLGEGRGRPRQRGRYTTSVDALVLVERADGGRTGLLVEWKFTESCGRPVAFRGPGGTDRRGIYRTMYEDSALFWERPPIDVYFQEPHYQLLRLALLGEGMAASAEVGMDKVVVVHAVPAGNRTLPGTVPDGLQHLGETVPAVWSRLLGPSFRWVDTAPLLETTGALAERYGST